MSYKAGETTPKLGEIYYILPCMAEKITFSPASKHAQNAAIIAGGSAGGGEHVEKQKERYSLKRLGGVQIFSEKKLKVRKYAG